MGRTELYNGALLTPPPSDEHLPTASSSSAHADAVYLERKMGDTELSYFLPSRQSGVNDMYVHVLASAGSPRFDESPPAPAGICISGSTPRRTS